MLEEGAHSTVKLRRVTHILTHRQLIKEILALHIVAFALGNMLCREAGLEAPILIEAIVGRHGAKQGIVLILLLPIKVDAQLHRHIETAEGGGLAFGHQSVDVACPKG